MDGQVYKSELFCFSILNGKIRVDFSTFPPTVKEYVVELRKNGKMIHNLLGHWDFCEGDKLHVLLENTTRTFVALDGELIEESEEKNNERFPY